MLNETLLKKLKIKELNNILKNIKLGKDHLLKLLSPNEMQDLLQVGNPQPSQKNKIKADKQEKAGRMALGVNTVITSCLGAWLGFSAYNQKNLGTIVTPIVIGIAIILGITIGYLSYYLTRKQANEAMTTQKLLNIELLIIKIIHKKREIIFKKLEEQIKDIINYLSDNTVVSEKNYSKQFSYILAFDDNSNPIISNLTDHLGRLKDAKIQDQYRHNATKILKSIEVNAIKLRSLISPPDKHKFVAPHSPHQHYENCFVKILAENNIKIKNTTPHVSYWIKNNILSILVGLMSTMLGGFASMFVFLVGIPDIFNHFSINFNLTDTTRHFVKATGLIVAISLACYYAYSQLHAEYKAFLRTKQLENTENLITEHNENLMKQLSIIQLLTKIKYSLVHLKSIYNTIVLLPKYTESTKVALTEE